MTPMTLDPTAEIGKAVPEQTPSDNIDIELETFLLDLIKNKESLPDVDIASSIIGGDVERTIEGSSTLTVTVRDPVGEILNSGMFDTSIDVRMDGLWFRLVGLNKNDDDLDLVFEDRDVTYIKSHKRVKAASRSKMTRAEFCLWLVRHVKKRKIRVVCPELHKKQPIKRSAPRGEPTDAQKERTRASGIDRDADLEVKGKKANPAQIAAMEEVLDAAHEITQGSLYFATLALIVANIGESSYNRGALNPSSKAKGIFQILPRYQHLISPNDIEGGVHIFMKLGFTRMPNRKQDWTKLPMGQHGAIGLARNRPEMSAGAIAAAVEGSDQGNKTVVRGGEKKIVNPFYDKHIDEAKKILDAYGGQGEAVGRRQRRKQYRFSTRDGDEAQNYWDAIGRLMDEVGWRRFMSNGVLYLISEEDLFKSKPRMKLSERSRGVVRVNFMWDTGMKLNTCDVRCRAERWFAPPGTVVEIVDAGPASGKWLVANIRRPIFSRECEIQLVKPRDELPEPPAQIITVEEEPTEGVRLAPVTGGRGAKTLRGIKLDSRWRGTQAIFEQFITPYMRENGLSPGSQKEQRPSNPDSDHDVDNKSSYAIDYPTRNGLAIASKLARKVGFDDWKPNVYQFHTVTIGRYKFRMQILWGAAIDHDDHIHVGFKRIG